MVELNAPSADYKAQQLPGWNSKGAFGGIRLQVVTMQTIKEFPYMCQVILTPLVFDYDVIHIHFNLLTKHVVKYGRHSSHVGGTGILED